MSSINRKMANLITSTGDVASSALDNAASMSVFSSVDSLPVSGLSAGDQALVGTRLYISNGSGWYNVALINATPTLTVSPSGTISLATDGATATTVTLTAADSDNSDANLVLTAESGGDFFKMATVSRDSSVFTITPRSKDSATSLGDDGTSTLTFKASDGISFGSNQVTFTLSFSIANSKYTTLLSKADAASTDDQVDAGPTTHAITETGPITSTALSPYHPGGYSTYIDGTNDWLVADLGTNIGTSDFTIEGWVKSDVNAHHGILQISGDTAGYLATGYGNTLALLFQSGYGWQIYGRGGATNSGGPSAITVNQWYHFAYVKTGGNAKLYIDGVQVITAADTTNYAVRYISIGRVYNANFDWTGHIRDVRVVVGTAVYTSSFTPPTEPLTAITNTKLLTCHLPYFGDGSADSRAITVNGHPPNERISPYDYLGYSKSSHAGSVYFDDAANTHMVTGPNNHADFGFGTGDWTVEMWIWVPSGYTQANNYIIDIGSNGLIFRIVNNKFTYTNSTLGFGGNLYNTGADFTNDSWHHMAVCRISGTVKMYMNGKETASETDTHSSSSTKVAFGRYGGSVAYQYTGYVSDLRIVKGTGVYTSNFTPPTEPLTAITNTVLLTCTNKNDIWEQADGKPFTKVSGGPTVSNTQRKFTTSSALYFAGTSNTYLLKDLGETIGTRDFTAEAWVYPTTTGAQHVFQISNQSVGYQSITSQNTQVGIGMNGGFWRYGTTGWNFGYVHTTTAVVVNTWHHVAYVRTGGYSKLYLNGTEIHSNADTSNYSARYLAYGVGHQSNNVWNGYTQGLRIAIGYARYTGAFTPPTTEFAG